MATPRAAEHRDLEQILHDLRRQQRSTFSVVYNGGVRQSYRDATVCTGGATETLPLTYKPADYSLHLYLNGQEQDDDTWTVDGYDLTADNADGWARAGGLLVAKYEYDDPTPRPADPPPSTVTVDVEVTRVRFVGVSHDEFIDMPAEVVFVGSPTDGDGTNLYAVEVGGVTVGNNAFVPATPDGYTLTSVYPICKAYAVSGAPTLVSSSSTGALFDSLPVGSYPSNPIVSDAADSLTGVRDDGLPADGWHIESAPVDVHLNYLGLRFTFTYTGG